VLKALVPRVARLLDAEHGLAYGFEPAGERLRVSFLHGTPTYSWSVYRADLDALVQRAPSGWAAYDPMRPARSQRNRAMVLPVYEPSRQGGYGEMLRRHGRAAEMHQARVLVCDDDLLDAWVGGVREEPFGERERRLLGRIIAPLRTRLALERRLERSSITVAALGAALERMGAAAYVVHSQGAVLHANSAGRARLDGDRIATLEALRSALRGARDAFDATPLEAKGIAHHWLAVARPSDGIGGHVERVVGRWGLTKRQGEVLLLLAQGESNKGIATRLGCTEATVEFHVTNLLAKCGADGRSRLVARMLAER
jgi:DNA-binding NarL/FixJ family response regulator